MKKYFLLSLCIIVWMPGLLFAQALNPGFWVANGQVKTMVNDNDTVYIGGNFTKLSAATGGGVVVSATGAGDTISGFPHVCGYVRFALPDGVGGWYIGGKFTCAGGLTRNNIARIRADFSVDPDFHPDVTGGDVYSLSISGDDIYLSGAFTSVSGVARMRVAAVNRFTGDLKPWQPFTTFLPNAATTIVYSILVSGRNVFVGGNFTTLGASPRRGIASIDTADVGVIHDWNPAGDIGGCTNLVSNYAVRALLMKDATLYVGGDFDTLGGCGLRQYLAALDTATGEHTNWRPSTLLSTNNTAGRGVYSMAISGDTLYAGGSFDKLGGVSSNHLVAVSLIDTGRVMNWVTPMNPAGASTIVFGVTVVGNNVYAVGNFTTAGGTPVNYMASIDRTSAFVNTNWHPDPNLPTIYCVSAIGNSLYFGGTFTGLRGLFRNRIARFSALTGVVDPIWNPNVGNATTSIVNAIAIKDTSVFIGGNFVTVGSATRYDLAEVGKSYAGAFTPWGPGPVITTSTIMVNALAFSASKDTLYVGGSFVTIGGQARNRIAALSPYTNAAYAWNPNAKNTVYSLKVKDGLVYAGGLFDSIAGVPRKRIAALDPITGSPTAWDPGASITSATNTGAIFDLQLSEDSMIYAGGAFVGLQGRSRLASININTGQIRSSFNPNPTTNQVNTIFIKDDSLVYVGGTFVNIGGAARNRAAVVSATTGSAFIWNPSPDNTVDKIIESGGALMLSGTFQCINSPGIPSSYFAGLMGTCLNSFGQASDTVMCAGDTVALQASGGISYSWTPITYLQNPTSATPLAHPLVTTNYSVVINGFGGCSQTIPITLTVHQLPITPEVSFCNGTSFVCAPDSICLTTGVQNQYTWSPTGETTQKIYANTTGNYSVKVTDVYNCSSYSDTVAVTIYPLPPTPNILVSGGILTTSSTAPTYQWWIQTGGTWFPISGANFSFYQPTSPGIFKVCIADVNTCESCSDPFEVLGMDDLNTSGTKMVLSPNPAVGQTTIQFELQKSTDLFVAVYDVLGNRVMLINDQNKVPAGTYSFTIDLPAAGVYTVRMLTEEGQVIKRLVKN